jgi:hypothetical protein
MPSWRGLYDYDATAFSPVIGDEPVGAGKIEVMLPFSAPGLDGSDLSFKTNLVNSSTGESLDVPLELKELTKSGAIAAQKIEISLDQIAKGKYLLSVHVGNRADGQVVSARVPLTIAR